MLVLKVKYNGSWTNLDLYGDESINFNKSVLEVQEFDKRSSDFTKQFRLPGTEINNKIMGNIFKINLEDSSFDPKQSLECAITIAGQVLLVGSMRLEKMYVNVQKNDYEVVIYSQLGSLASSISEKTLCDLDFSEYTHSLTYSNIGSSWNLNLFNGDIVYPFIHYGYDDEDIIPDLEFTNTPYSFDQSSNALPFWYYKPSIRVGKVIEKIINESGYEMSSSFLTSQEFRKIYMPLSFSSELGVQTIEDISFYASLSTSDSIPVGNHNVVFDIEISDTSNNYNNITGQYTFTKEGRYSFKVDYTLSTIDCCEYEGDPYYHLYDRWVRDRGGNETYFQDRFLGYNCDVSDVPFQKFITIDVGSSTSTSDWKVGDKISFGTSKVVKDCESYTLTSTHPSHTDFEYYACETTTNPITLRVYAGTPQTICANPDIPPVIADGNTGTIVDNGPCASIHPCDATINFLSTFLLYDTPSEPGDGSDVVISENMSCDTTQLDFLKGIFTHYNMVVVPDPNDPITLIIEPWVNWVNSPDVEVRDWTNYLDLTRDVSIQPLVDNDNRYVKFTDTEDSDKLNKFNQDNYNQIFGEYTYDSGSQIVANTKEIDTIFSPTPSEQLDGNTRMIVPKLFEEDDAGNRRVFSTNPRLLYYNGMLDIFDTYYVRDENDVVYSHNQYPCMSVVQDLDTDLPTTDIKTLTWDKVYNYYTQLSGYNSINAQGSYYELFWKDYFVDIYDSDSRIITAYFNIPFQEFIQIKLNDRIQISGLFGNTQWRINRIIDYDLIDPGMTKVELIKSLVQPESVKTMRTYLIEKCDELQQITAQYPSVEPLVAGSSVKIAGFDDCYFVVEETEIQALREITETFTDCNECLIGVERVYSVQPYAYGYASQDTDNYNSQNTITYSEDYDYNDFEQFLSPSFPGVKSYNVVMHPDTQPNYVGPDIPTFTNTATFDVGVGIGNVELPIIIENIEPQFSHIFNSSSVDLKLEVIWDGVIQDTYLSAPENFYQITPRDSVVGVHTWGKTFSFTKTSSFPRTIEIVFSYTYKGDDVPGVGNTEPDGSGDNVFPAIDNQIIVDGGYKKDYLSPTGYSTFNSIDNSLIKYVNISSPSVLPSGTPIVIEGNDYFGLSTTFYEVVELDETQSPTLTGFSYFNTEEKKEIFHYGTPKPKVYLVQKCDDNTLYQYYQPLYFGQLPHAPLTNGDTLIMSNGDKLTIKGYVNEGVYPDYSLYPQPSLVEIKKYDC